MPSPPIQIFLTTIASQPALRQRQEYLLRILQVKKIPFTSYDLASDEEAKKLWKRKAPPANQQLPGILAFTDFEEAVEYGELETFLRLKDSWNAEIEEDRPAPVAKPIGVPGAVAPLQMTPEHLRSKILAPISSPLKGKGKPLAENKKEGLFDLGDELIGFGLQGVKVTEDELMNLVAELGLDGDEAKDLVEGLSTNAPKDTQPEAPNDKAASLTSDAAKTVNEPVKEAVPEKESASEDVKKEVEQVKETEGSK
ncbi:hypothetical protein CCMSSC00406_0004600 [Pleurotus cornucopiae]|uniref:Uncharacterized protein n=1 Tax=Pleurotus cornucopiae TaxID=5321 RepID=A0ACB7IXR3_PLECO|nr:hypothetical protein CCMSSC00406_0004600 [Pleurotus cornucopiae]